MENKLGRWRSFLDSLATDGGNDLMLYMLVVGCLTYLHFHPDMMKAGEVLTGAFGAWLMRNKKAGTNRDQISSNPAPPTSTPSAPVSASNTKTEGEN